MTWGVKISAVVALIASVTAVWNVRVAVGIAAGGAWNLLSVWCLTQLLQTWLGPKPSRRRALIWLTVKFPLLYGLAILIVRHPSVSIGGFSAGFILSLFLLMLVSLRRFARPSLDASHDP